MKTLILTQHENGEFKIQGNVTDMVERIGMIESARIMSRCEFIQRVRTAEMVVEALQESEK